MYVYSCVNQPWPVPFVGKRDDHLVGILHIICDDGWIVRNDTAYFHHGDLPKIPFTTCYNNIIPRFEPINGGSRS